MLYLSIILLSWLVWCVNGRPLPCTMVDETKGAMLCCDYQPLPHEEGLTGIKAQSNQVLHSDKKCTLITPKSSLGLVKEVWSLRNYTWAAGMLKTKLPNTKDIPRHKGCCCDEQFVFSISNEGISAVTGKTHKIVQQDQYVQPILSLLCVKNDDCHVSGNMKVFQRMEAHNHYVESEDHPDYVQEELLLKPSGCLCVPDTQTVKADIGEILIPMNLIEEAMADSRIVKRNAEYGTELPEILRLALEIMREPNPLPVLDSVERQMAMQLQQTRYFAAMAMASGLGNGGGLGPNNINISQTKADMESLKKFPLHSYQLILSAFLSGLALGQNFQNISQVEILDRLIVDNGNSGINLLETILKLQNHSNALDYNSLEFNYSNGTYSNKTILYDNNTNVDSGSSSHAYATTSNLSSPTYATTSYLSSPTYATTSYLSSPTYDTTSYLSNPVYVNRTSELSSPTYVTKSSNLNSPTYVNGTSDLSSLAYVTTSSGLSSTTHYTSYTVFSNTTHYTSYIVYSSTTHVTSTDTAGDTTEQTVIPTSSKDNVTPYPTPAAMVDTSKETSIDTSSEELKITPSAASTDSAFDASLADSTTEAASIDQASSQKVDFVSNDLNIDTTSDSSVYSSSYEEYTTSDSSADVDNIDSTKDTVIYTSSEKEYTTPVADSHIYFDEKTSTNAPVIFDATEHESSNEDYSTHPASPMIGNFEGGGYTYPDEGSTSYVPAVADGEIQHTSTNDYYTIDSAAMVDSTTGPVGHTSFNGDYTTGAADIVGTTEDSDYIRYTEGATKEYTTDDAEIVGTTEKSDFIRYTEDGSTKDYTTVDAEIVGTTEDSDYVRYTKDGATKDYTTDVDIFGTTKESDYEEYSTNAAEYFGSNTESTNSFYSEDVSTASTMNVSTAESVHTSYNDDDDTTVETKEPGVTTPSDEYVTTSNISTGSEIPGSKFNLREYINGLPQFQPLTIDTELLMHIMFPPEPITHDDRAYA